MNDEKLIFNNYFVFIFINIDFGKLEIDIKNNYFYYIKLIF